MRKRAVDVWKTTARDHPALPSLRLSLVAAYGSLRAQPCHARPCCRGAGATICEGIEQIERFPRDGAEDLFALAQARARSSEWHIWNVSKGPTEGRPSRTAGEADSAIDALRQAVAAGFRDPNRLRLGFPRDRCTDGPISPR